MNWTMFPPPTPSVCVMGGKEIWRKELLVFLAPSSKGPWATSRGTPSCLPLNLSSTYAEAVFSPISSLPHSLITCSPITPKSESQNPTLVSNLGSRVDLPPAHAKQNCSILPRIASPYVFLVFPSTDAETPNQDRESVFSSSTSLSLSSSLLSWHNTSRLFFFSFFVFDSPSLLQ